MSLNLSEISRAGAEKMSAPRFPRLRENVQRNRRRWSISPHLLEVAAAGSHIPSEWSFEGGTKIEERRRGESGPAGTAEVRLGWRQVECASGQLFALAANSRFLDAIQ